MKESKELTKGESQESEYEKKYKLYFQTKEGQQEFAQLSVDEQRKFNEKVLQTEGKSFLDDIINSDPESSDAVMAKALIKAIDEKNYDGEIDYGPEGEEKKVESLGVYFKENWHYYGERAQSLAVGGGRGSEELKIAEKRTNQALKCTPFSRHG